jgi:DNA repair ATPase RecN
LNPGNVESFANAIEIGAIKLPELRSQHKSLQNKIQTIQYQKQKLERDLQAINTRLIELSDIEKMHQQNFDILADNVCELQNQKHQLEQFAFRFKNSNKKYLKVKSIAEENVNRLLTDRESLLTSALIAVVEALRMNPDRYNVIYNSKYDDGIAAVGIPSSSTSTSSHSPSAETYQNYYYNKYHEGLVEIAKGFLNILLNQLVDKTMVAAVKGQ